MIYGDRVRLRHVEQDDLPLFVEWLNDPEVTRGLALRYPLSMGEEEDWYEGVLKGPVEERPLGIDVEEAEGWRLIGNSGFMSVDWRNRSAELGIFIGDKSYWNQGYGTEVVRLLMKHGFSTLNLHRIFLRVFEDNPRAIRSYEKAGFINEGRQRQAEYHNGVFHDVIMMSILHPDWDQLLEE